MDDTNNYFIILCKYSIINKRGNANNITYLKTKKQVKMMYKDIRVASLQSLALKQMWKEVGLKINDKEMSMLYAIYFLSSVGERITSYNLHKSLSI